MKNAYKWTVEEELRSAGSRLRASEERDEAIHQARRSLKKARSALKLMRSRLGAGFRMENARLRDIGRSLSPLRDAVAIIETFDALRKKYRGRVSADGFRTARAALVRMKKEIDSHPNAAKVLRNAATNLSKKRVAWQLETGGLSELEKTFRKGRKALARVHEHPRPENFHTLRKRVKTYRFQLRLLGEKRAGLDELDGWLGEAHNLTLLKERITASPTRFGAEQDVDEILDLIAKRQKSLREKSLVRAEEIYD